MTTIESIWYASDPYPPHSKRLSRLPWHAQLGAAFDLAIDIETGEAGCRHHTVSATGERYWCWPEREHDRGIWWLLPPRTEILMRRARAYAMACARECTRIRRWEVPPNDDDETLQCLIRRFGADVGARYHANLRRLQRRAYRARQWVERHVRIVDRDEVKHRYKSAAYAAVGPCPAPWPQDSRPTRQAEGPDRAALSRAWRYRAYRVQVLDDIGDRHYFIVSRAPLYEDAAVKTRLDQDDIEEARARLPDTDAIIAAARAVRIADEQRAEAAVERVKADPVERSPDADTRAGRRLARAIRNASIIEAAAQGSSQREIAQRHGLTAAAVGYVLKKHRRSQ